MACHGCRSLLLLNLVESPRGVDSALLVSGQTACSASRSFVLALVIVETTFGMGLHVLVVEACRVEAGFSAGSTFAWID